MNIGSVPSPPTEGDNASTAARISLTINPTNAELGPSITVGVDVLAIEFATATGMVKTTCIALGVLYNCQLESFLRSQFTAITCTTILLWSIQRNTEYLAINTIIIIH